LRPLAEAPDWDDRDEEPVLPEEINGKKVVSIDDDRIIDGDLCCIDDQSLTFDKAGVERGIQWLTENRWRVTSGVIEELRKVVSG
jgi:hypothetical protein